MPDDRAARSRCGPILPDPPSCHRGYLSCAGGGGQKKREAFEKELIAVGGDRSPAPDELQPTICACLERLPPALRLAYADLLRRIDLAGQSPEQVAQALQITQNNLTVRVHRARQALRTSLEQTCGLCTKHGWVYCTCEQKAEHGRS